MYDILGVKVKHALHASGKLAESVKKQYAIVKVLDVISEVVGPPIQGERLAILLQRHAKCIIVLH